MRDETRRQFARDLRNLTLASPQLNRYRKVAKDAAEWLPEKNRCWFAHRVIDVRQGLFVDRSIAARPGRWMLSLRRAIPPIW